MKIYNSGVMSISLDNSFIRHFSKYTYKQIVLNFNANVIKLNMLF